MKNFLLKITLVFIFVFYFAARPVFAEDIFCDLSSCTPATQPSIYSSELWYPMRNETKQLTIHNVSPAGISPQLIGLTVIPHSSDFEPVELANVMTMRLSDNYGFIHFDGKLIDFYTLNEFPLVYLSPGANATFSFSLTMDNVGDEWQEKTTVFDMILGFTAIQISPTPTPTPTPEPGPTSTPGPGPTSTPGPNPTATPTSSLTAEETNEYYSAEYEGEIIEVPSIKKETKKKDKQVVLGKKIAPEVKGESVCVDPWWWWVVLIVQGIIEFSCHQTISKKRSRKTMLAISLISGLIGAIVLYLYFCTKIYFFISLIISSLFLFFTSRQNKF